MVLSFSTNDLSYFIEHKQITPRNNHAHYCHFDFVLNDFYICTEPIQAIQGVSIQYWTNSSKYISIFTFE